MLFIFELEFHMISVAVEFLTGLIRWTRRVTPFLGLPDVWRCNSNYTYMQCWCAEKEKWPEDTVA